MNTVILILMTLEVIVGIMINIEKIKKVRIDKHITWELEIYSSVICIIYITMCLTFDVMEYTCPEFGYIVKLIVHVIWSISKTFGVNIILFHSWSVAAYKYYVIAIRRPIIYNHQSMDSKWLVGLITFPIVWTLSNLVRSTAMAALIDPTPLLRCQSNDFKEHISIFCKFEGDDNYNNKWTTLYIVTQMYCLVHTIINIAFTLNLLEAFLYFKIFDFMKRYKIKILWLQFGTLI